MVCTGDTVPIPIASLNTTATTDSAGPMAGQTAASEAEMEEMVEAKTDPVGQTVASMEEAEEAAGTTDVTSEPEAKEAPASATPRNNANK